MGFRAQDAIEPVDGFHPSGLSNYISTEIMWPQLLSDHPDWFGPVNPYNDFIDMMFPLDNDEEIKISKKAKSLRTETKYE